MEIEFDPAKDAANRQEHGVSLMFGEVVLSDVAGEVEDTRQNHAEKRMKAFAQINGLWFECVYTMNGTAYRIISVHRVREGEVGRWLKW
jgi:uncharacterized DUF497 family protein